MINVKEQISAALLRRDMKKARRAHGLTADLRFMIAEYRIVCPEYAKELERTIYPPLMTSSGLLALIHPYQGLCRTSVLRLRNIFRT